MPAKSPKYVFTDDMASVTGYGGESEAQAQRAVAAGIEWLETHPCAKPAATEGKFVYGFTDSNEDAKALSAVIGAEFNGASGGVVECCLGHVLWAYQHGGWDAYVAESKLHKE